MFKLVNFLFLLVLLKGCGGKPGVTNPEAPAPVILGDKACSEFGKADCPGPKCEFYNNACEEKSVVLEIKRKKLEEELEDLKNKPENEKTEEEKKKQKELEEKLEEELKKSGTNNDKEQENLAKYNEQFKDYIASFDNPKDPPKWVLVGDGEQNNNDGKYELPKDISDYIAGIDDVKAAAKKICPQKTL